MNCQPDPLFFVYGTLKRGEVRERCWPAAPLKVEAAVVKGCLYDLGPYPALVEGEDLVLGELWTISADRLEETLRVLDAVEGHQQGGDDLYVRRIVECQTLDGRRRRAYVYFFTDQSKLAEAAVVPPNDEGLCEWSRFASRD